MAPIQDSSGQMETEFDTIRVAHDFASDQAAASSEAASSVTVSSEAAISETAAKKKKKKKKPLSQTSQPCTVVRKPVVGSCVVVAKSIAAGVVISAEKPVAAIVRWQRAGDYCAACCSELAETKRRSSCPWATYCSDACMESSKALRDIELEALLQAQEISKAVDIDLDLLRMLIRLCAVRHLQGEDTPQWQGVLQLMQHREHMPAAWLAAVTQAAERMLPLLPEAVRCDADLVCGLACRINTNAHGLEAYGAGGGVVGLGLFPFTALINHSCAPNCVFVWKSGHLEVRTVAAVASGEELCVHYIDLLQVGTSIPSQLLNDCVHFSRV
jgi:SET domain